MLAVYNREMQAYFLTPIGYVFMGSFLLIQGIFFTFGNIFAQSSDFSSMFSNLSFIFMLVVPILTMRLMSDERRNKSDQLLLTSPVSLLSIVVGKFLAACTVFLVTLGITGIYVLILSAFGVISVPEVLVNYFGFFLTGCCLIAVGLLISAMTESQVTAAIATFGIILLFFLMDGMAAMITAPFLAFLVAALQWLSLFQRFEAFSAGIFSLTGVIYMLSFAAVFLYLTVSVIEKRRWSEG
ncbi:MAG: ABC transporter permease [Christensenellaceae bacterium]|jgi:ABC-2 type transport system permease protein|nr:ABC transporter permease [Christensenellaceae bacterium]